jgi:DNA-binding transcriptional MerR regulator
LRPRGEGLDIQVGLKAYRAFMAGYRISEVAAQTGFSTSTLRFYEDVGLISPAGRLGNGYRKYDERDLDRLRFIARCKRLGLTLEEITGLVELFELDECAPVQERLRELLVAKRRDVKDQIAELENLSGELARVADRLGVPASAGACDDSCACFADDGTDAAVVLETIPFGTDSIRDAPIACTLDPAAMLERVTEWQTLAAKVVERTDAPDGVQLRFTPDVSAAEVAELATKEHGCCSFLDFSVGITNGETTLTIAAPSEARETIDTLLQRS